LPFIPLGLSVECYRKIALFYGDSWLNQVIRLAEDDKCVDILFLVTLFWNGIEGSVVLRKLHKRITSSEVRCVAKFIFEDKMLSDRELAEMIEKYPQFSLWVLEKSPLLVEANLREILERFPNLLVVSFKLVVILSRKTLVWLFDQIVRGKVRVIEAVKIILEKPRPFSTKEFEKVRTVEQFEFALKKTGMID